MVKGISFYATKRIIFLFFFLGVFQSAQAQFEIKFNPPALIFEALQLSTEVIINDEFGIGLDVIAASGFYSFALPAKYYFNPKYGADRFNAGVFLYMAPNDEDFGSGGGFVIGYKWLSKRNIVLDFDIGIGRSTGSFNVIPYGKFVFGYRFKKKEQE